MSENSTEWSKREKKIRKDERKRYKSKRRAKGTIYTMVGALIAFLISLFSGFLGLNPVGIYTDGTGSHSVLNKEVEETPEADPVKMAEESNEVIIIVKDDAYVHGEITYDLAGITEVVQSLEQSSPIKLVDRLADNDAFEEIEALLNGSGIEYNIVEDYE